MLNPPRPGLDVFELPLNDARRTGQTESTRNIARTGQQLLMYILNTGSAKHAFRLITKSYHHDNFHPLHLIVWHDFALPTWRILCLRKVWGLWGCSKKDPLTPPQYVNASRIEDLVISGSDLRVHLSYLTYQAIESTRFAPDATHASYVYPL